MPLRYVRFPCFLLNFKNQSSKVKLLKFSLSSRLAVSYVTTRVVICITMAVALWCDGCSEWNVVHVWWPALRSRLTSCYSVYLALGLGLDGRLLLARAKIQVTTREYVTIKNADLGSSCGLRGPPALLAL